MVKRPCFPWIYRPHVIIWWYHPAPNPPGGSFCIYIERNPSARHRHLHIVASLVLHFVVSRACVCGRRTSFNLCRYPAGVIVNIHTTIHRFPVHVCHACTCQSFRECMFLYKAIKLRPFTRLIFIFACSR